MDSPDEYLLTEEKPREVVLHGCRVVIRHRLRIEVVETDQVKIARMFLEERAIHLVKEA